MKKVIVLGATSHIAKNLIFYLSKEYELILFARNTASVIKFLEKYIITDYNISVFNLDLFEDFGDKSDVIINCIGFGTPDKVITAGYDLYRITERFDNLSIDYIFKNPETLFINLSSGAVYGTNFYSPACEKFKTEIDVNDIQTSDHYRMSKIYSESKHRLLKNLNIVDIRIFSFFSRFIDLNSSYLISDIINCIKNKTVFKTDGNDITRDFTSPEDLVQLVQLCIEKQKINNVFDLYSKMPLTKFQLIEMMKEKFGLMFEIENTGFKMNPTGLKKFYFSENYRAGEIGFNPRYSSLETVLLESEKILDSINPIST